MHRIRRFGVMKTANTAAALYMVAIGILVVPLALLVSMARQAFDGGGIAAGGIIVFALVVIVGYGS